MNPPTAFISYDDNSMTTGGRLPRISCSIYKADFSSLDFSPQNTKVQYPYEFNIRIEIGIIYEAKETNEANNDGDCHYLYA